MLAFASGLLTFPINDMESTLMANNLLTNDIILKTALMEFTNNLVFAKTARRDYQDKFNSTTGSTIRIRKPTRYESRTGQNISVQAINEQYTNITVGNMVGVDVEVTSTELALQLDDFNREILNPAMVTLANKIDSLLYETSTEISNFVGTAGTAPSSFSVASDAESRLDSFGVPQGKDRFMMLKSFDAGSMRSALYNTFNENFNKEIIMNGSMGNLSGFDCYSVQNIIRPSRGSDTLGTPIVSVANQTGSSLTVTGFAANAIVKKGALFTIAGVNSLNPTSRTDTGQLAQFVITADTQADGAGAAVLPIEINEDGIVLTGPYRNVSIAPPVNALLTFQATHTKNLFYHREAFALVTIKLPEIANGESAYQKNMMDPKAKINIRMTRQYQIANDQYVLRFDVLPAVKCFPQYAGILMGS
jgi:hypothetical protein